MTSIGVHRMTTGRRRWRDWSVLVLVASTALVGCGEDEGPSYQDEDLSAIDATADVDAETGRIVLPVERYFVSPEEQIVIDNAAALAIQVCCAENGFVFDWAEQRADTSTDRRYGVWLARDAERFGYAVNTGGDEAVVPDAEAETGTAHDPTDAEWDILMACHETPEIQRFKTEDIVPAFDYPAEIGGITDEVFTSDAGAQVFADWEECLASKGLERDTSASPFAIRGASTEVTEQNITIAVADVACKDAVRFVERLADLEAEAQAPVVAHYAKELSAMRAQYEDLLRCSEEYLAAHRP